MRREIGTNLRRSIPTAEWEAVRRERWLYADVRKRLEHILIAYCLSTRRHVRVRFFLRSRYRKYSNARGRRRHEWPLGARAAADKGPAAPAVEVNSRGMRLSGGRGRALAATLSRSSRRARVRGI
ncbi:hypothetical protein EVAR_39811_1 [Eumeta japonica]|uniref:Uncharacterized protein n=1 Tax=Eumeta variegata TaxID=151549 RepID=A0A4C1X784_EUMVA|nr:hypothetical protein EVAR_39811_1 [Eumeta japonica]